MLVDPANVQPKLLLQAVPEPKAVKNRMHLDIETPNIDAEADRLQSLGARRIEEGTHSEHGTNWVIMADLEGNEFSACATVDPPDTGPRPNAPRRVLRRGLPAATA